MTVNKLKYPIGQFCKPAHISTEQRKIWIDTIAAFPDALQLAVSTLTNLQLDSSYRPKGWTVRQVVHHCADSHMNSLIRFKLALTEEQPIIKPYFEERWAELADSKPMPVGPSLLMIKGIHERWVTLLKSLTNEQCARIFVHPEHGAQFTID